MLFIFRAYLFLEKIGHEILLDSTFREKNTGVEFQTFRRSWRSKSLGTILEIKVQWNLVLHN